MICANYSLTHIQKKNLYLNANMFPIHWCHHQVIMNNFWDKWYIVFDDPPCNNCEVPQYFLRKL